MTSSCGATFYHARFPILEKPIRPPLKGVPGEQMKKLDPQYDSIIKQNMSGLIDYSKKLEATIEIYNNHAKEQNKILDIVNEPKKKKPGFVKRVFGGE